MNPANNTHNLEQLPQQIAEILTKNSSGIIALPANPSVDAIASATALYLALTKMGKGVTLVSTTTPQSDLVAADKIQQSISAGGDNLIVSFPYTEGTIDKVDYNIQGSTFNLVLVPRAGFPKIEPKQVQFSYSGGKIEFIVTVDAPNLNSLGSIYQENQNQFQGQNLINIDRHLINNSFGLLNYVHKTSSSTSELVFKVLKALRIDMDKDMVTNLYAGIVAATNGFTSYSVNAETFETAAELLKRGAVKKPMNKPGSGGGNSSGGRGQHSNPFAGVKPPNSPVPLASQDSQANFDDMPLPPQRGEQQTRQIEDVEHVSNTQEGSEPENWLKPKIFDNGGGLV